MTLPILRLELEHMKLAILNAFSEHQVKLDGDVKAAVEAFCTPSHLKSIITKAVDDTLRVAIQREVESFYHCGEGRQVIADAVIAKLREGLNQ